MLSMQSKGKSILLGSVAVLVIAAVVLWYVDFHSTPKFAFSPIPKNAPTLDETDIKRLSAVMEPFHVYKRTRQVPAAVKESFSNFTGLPFDLAEPGDEISSDVMISGKSSRRLVFLGLRSNSAILFYQQGGFIGTFNAVVFIFGEKGRVWGADLEHGPVPRNGSDFLTALRIGNFHPWVSPDTAH